MKKIIYSAMAVAMLATTSCKDDFAESFVGEEATVEFSISTPEIGTRAYSDGMTVNELHYAIYDGNKLLTALSGTEEVNQGHASLSVDLKTGKTYKAIFWADYNDKDPNTADPYQVVFTDGSATMTVNYDGAVSNDETRDAFYTVQEIKVDGNATVNVKLTRPFAQLNIAASDFEEAEKANYIPNASSIKVYGAANTLNFLTGAITGKVDVTFASTAIPTEDLTVNDITYDYLAMTYVLPADNKTVMDIDFTIVGNTHSETRTVGSVPFQSNYRTNIYGNILTSQQEVNITIDPAFGGDKTVDALFQAAAFGGEVTLTDDVVLDAPLKVQANMTLNLGGHTITTTWEKEKEGRHHYAIDNYATLVIEGEGAINARGIQNFGEMTINGDITITNVDTNGGSAIWNEGELVINGGTFKTNNQAGEGSYGSALNTQVGGKAVVNGGTFEAYSQLTYAILNYGETVINDATVKGKHGAVASSTGCITEINGGSFELMGVSGQSDHCAYFVSDIRGGVFSRNEADTSAGDSVFYKSKIADGYKEIEKDGKYYVVPEEAVVVTTATELTTALAAGQAVVLTKDIEIGKIDLTSGTSDVVIDANGNTITTTYSYGIEATAGKNITIKNATIGITKEGDYITYAAGLKIANGDYAGKTIKLENCKISMANTDWAYAVTMPASVKNLNLVLDKCELEGAVAVQCWGDNNKINITNSKLICNYTTSELYTSYCVALQGDGTYDSENNELTIANCEFLYSGVDNFNSPIYAIGNKGSNNTITTTDCTYGEKIVP